MRSLRTVLLLLTVVLLVAPVSTFAHAGGQQWSAVSGHYVTDVSNDTPVIVPGQTVGFYFELFNYSDPAYGPDEVVDYSFARATLMHGSEQVFLKDIPYDSDRELAGFDYVFPDQNADYSLTIQYHKSGAEIASAVVPLMAGTGDTSRAGAVAVGVLTALLVFVVGARMLGIGKVLVRFA